MLDRQKKSYFVGNIASSMNDSSYFIVAGIVCFAGVLIIYIFRYERASSRVVLEKQRYCSNI